jgi:hypothetical protein
LVKVLFIFLDGVGLGVDDPEINPLAKAEMPALTEILDGRRLVAASAPCETERATLLALDACLGVNGLPQSATGQTVLLSGVNVPAALGYHYGPKPNPQVAEFVRNGNLLSRIQNSGKRIAYLNAFPPRYFEAINTGRRLYSAIPLAAVSAGVPLRTAADLRAGLALSADFTAQGWSTHLGLKDTPTISLKDAGRRMARLGQEHDFSLFEYWLSDYAGHGQDMAAAQELLQAFDQVLEGLLEAWNDSRGLILVTSDHGNLEDLSTRRHTTNPVPALLVGEPQMRREFATGLRDLTGIAPAILNGILNQEP